MLANCGVQCWPTVRNVRLIVPLVNELFANKDPTVAQTLTAHLSIQFDVARIHYFSLAEQRSKLEGLLLTYRWCVIRLSLNRTLSHLLFQLHEA